MVHIPVNNTGEHNRNLADVHTAMTEVNNLFQDINFVYCLNIHDSPELYVSTPTKSLLISSGEYNSDAMNLVLGHPDHATGRDCGLLNSDFAKVMSGLSVGTDLIAHELGHALGLLHTFGATGNTEGLNYGGIEVEALPGDIVKVTITDDSGIHGGSDGIDDTAPDFNIDDSGGTGFNSDADNFFDLGFPHCTVEYFGDSPLEELRWEASMNPNTNPMVTYGQSGETFVPKSNYEIYLASYRLTSTMLYGNCGPSHTGLCGGGGFPLNFDLQSSGCTFEINPNPVSCHPDFEFYYRNSSGVTEVIDTWPNSSAPYGNRSENLMSYTQCGAERGFTQGQIQFMNKEAMKYPVTLNSSSVNFIQVTDSNWDQQSWKDGNYIVEDILNINIDLSIEKCNVFFTPSGGIRLIGGSTLMIKDESYLANSNSLVCSGGDPSSAPGTTYKIEIEPGNTLIVEGQSQIYSAETTINYGNFNTESAQFFYGSVLYDHCETANHINTIFGFQEIKVLNSTVQHTNSMHCEGDIIDVSGNSNFICNKHFTLDTEINVNGGDVVYTGTDMFNCVFTRSAIIGSSGSLNLDACLMNEASTNSDYYEIHLNKNFIRGNFSDLIINNSVFINNSDMSILRLFGSGTVNIIDNLFYLEKGNSDYNLFFNGVSGVVNENSFIDFGGAKAINVLNSTGNLKIECNIFDSLEEGVYSTGWLGKQGDLDRSAGNLFVNMPNNRQFELPNNNANVYYSTGSNNRPINFMVDCGNITCANATGEANCIGGPGTSKEPEDFECDQPVIIRIGTGGGCIPTPKDEVEEILSTTPSWCIFYIICDAGCIVDTNGDGIIDENDCYPCDRDGDGENDENGCYNSSTNNNSEDVDIRSKAPNNNDEIIAISPNPFINDFNLSIENFDTSAKYFIKLFDLNGREVNMKEINYGKLQLGMEISSGIYFYTIIKNDVNVKSGKLVKVY